MKTEFTLIRMSFFICFSFLLSSGFAENGHVRPIQFNSLEYVNIFSTAIDTGNRIITVGDFSDSAYIQGTKQGFGGKDSFDAFITCTDETGKILWQKIFGAAYSTWATNVICDHAGNYFISGYFEKGFKLDGVSFDSSSYYNSFLMKLDNNGKVLWAYCHAVTNVEYTTTLTCDADGNIYHLLGFYNSIKIDKQVFTNNNAGFSNLLIKYDKNGGLVWGKVMSSRLGGYSALACDLFGHIYIGGSTGNGKLTWDGQNVPGENDTVTKGLFIAKLDQASGKMMWIQRGQISSQSYATLTHIIVGGAGSLFIAGDFGDTLHFSGQDIATMQKTNPHNMPNALIMNLDTSGNLIWYKHFGAPDEPDYIDAMCIDNADYLYVGGTFDEPITLDKKNYFSTLARDIFIFRFDRSGNYVGSLSSKAMYNVSYAFLENLMVDQKNKLFVTGNLNYQTEFGTDTISSTGQNTGFIWAASTAFSGIEPELDAQIINGYKLYPNPLVGNILNLETSILTKGPSQIICTDVEGKLVFSKIMGQDIVDKTLISFQLPQLNPGVYFLKVLSIEGVASLKFVKQ